MKSKIYCNRISLDRFSVLLGFAVALATLPAAAHSEGVLFGSVMAQDGSSIPMAEFVLIGSDGKRTRVTADERGRYRVRLSPGIYEFADEPINRFSPFRRSRFIVAETNPVLINITPVPPAPIIDYVCPQNRDCAPPKTYSPPRYETLYPKNDRALDLVIRFSESQTVDADLVQYQGLYTMASYDVVSIYANPLYRDGHSNQISADHGFLEDGKSRRPFDHMILDPVARTIITDVSGERTTETF